MNQELAELLQDFISEAEERLGRIEGILMTLAESPPALRRSGLDELRRELHTLKGNSGMMGFEDMQRLAHAMEDGVQALDPEDLEIGSLLTDLDHFKHLVATAAGGDDSEPDTSERASESSIRVPVEHLDELVDLSAELVIARNRLDEAVAAGLAEASEAAASELDAWKRVDEGRRGLDKLLDAVQRRIERLRMVPLRKVFAGLRRVVHDEGQRAGKQVRMVTRGEETPIDNSLVEFAAEVLGHLVRNAVVHGVEAAEVRRKAGKPATGTVLLAASVRARNVVIEVVDDGGGIDRRALLTAARQAGLQRPERMDLQELVLHPGLSTRTSVDRSAGRGIGLSAVAASARRYGGAIEIESRRGVGTRCRLQLPLAVAVTEALLVEVAGEEYALPASAVLETLEIEPDDLERGFVEIGERRIPLVALETFFTRHSAATRGRYGVILEAEGRQRSIVVDEIGDLREIVVHRLEDALASVHGIGGTTILGNGRVILILDPPVLTATEEAA